MKDQQMNRLTVERFETLFLIEETRKTRNGAHFKSGGTKKKRDENDWKRD